MSEGKHTRPHCGKHKTRLAALCPACRDLRDRAARAEGEEKAWLERQLAVRQHGGTIPPVEGHAE